MITEDTSEEGEVENFAVQEAAPSNPEVNFVKISLN